MSRVEVLPRIIDTVTLIERDETRLILEDRRSSRRIQIDVHSKGLADAISALVGGAGVEELASQISYTQGIEATARFYLFLENARKNRLLVYEWRYGGIFHVILEPKCDEFSIEKAQREPRNEVLLSRFAYIRRDEDRLILDCPSAKCRVLLESPTVLTWLGQLTSPGRSKIPGFSEFAAMLELTGFLEAATTGVRNTGDFWEFHDRLFHNSSRLGLGSHPAGGSYRFAGKSAPEPALKPMSTRSPIPLQEPQLREMGTGEARSLFAVMERRESIREMDDRNPISAKEIGELLYRVGRIRHVRNSGKQEIISRPIPAAGAIHEIDFYLVVRQRDGLEKGLYYYNGKEHALCRCDTDDKHVNAFLSDASVAMEQPNSPPQCIVILTSRFSRIAWKYEGIAYRLTLMNAGVVLQSLYLVATELNLACSALGNGNSKTFALATGIDLLAETSIAEFALGSKFRPPDES